MKHHAPPTEAEIESRADALCAMYPYDPQIRPEVYEVGSPERLRGVPPGMREILARIYVRSFPRWQREADMAIRERLGKPKLAQDDSARRYP